MITLELTAYLEHVYVTTYVHRCMYIMYKRPDGHVLKGADLYAHTL